VIAIHHLGKDESLDLGDRNHSHTIVVVLLKGLEGRGHHVYTDNYYSSPALFSELRDLRFGACGTVGVNHCGLPPEMKATLAKGDMTSVQVDDSMMALRWMDKRPMLSTIHDKSMTTKVRRTCRAFS
jgi:hypothetical protein